MSEETKTDVINEGSSQETGRGSWEIPVVHDRLVSFIHWHKSESHAGYLLAGPYLLYMTLLFFIPLGYLFLVSFYIDIPVGTMKPGFTLANYAEFFSSEVYMNALYTTIEISIISTLFTILVSYPIAYFIVFTSWRYSKALILLVIAPMLVGNVVRAFGWFALMGPNGVLSRVVGYSLVGTMEGLIIAISSVLMPFAILILMSVLYTIDQELIEAAYNLGGNQLQTFLYVTLPLSLPGVIGATLISFVLTMGTFATDVFIGLPKVPMIAPFIYQVTGTLNWPLAAAMSFVMLAVSLVLVFLYTRVADIQMGGEMA